MSNDTSSRHDKRTGALIPDRHELWFRIHKVLMGASGTSKFCEMLEHDAGKELNAEEIAIMLRTAFAGMMLHTPYADRHIVTRHSLREFAAAIVDDEQVLADVICRLSTLENNEEKPSGYEPCPPRPWLGESAKRELIAQVKLFIRAYSQEIAGPGEDQTLCRFNLYPFYNQTASGMFLAFKGASPRQLWLPWGLCSLVTRVDDPARVAAFLARLELERVVPNSANIGDLHGPVFAVLALDDKPLHRPVQLTDHRQFTYTASAKEEWERLFNPE